jgi:hypothetical protein
MKKVVEPRESIGSEPKSDPISHPQPVARSQVCTRSSLKSSSVFSHLIARSIHCLIANAVALLSSLLSFRTLLSSLI